MAVIRNYGLICFDRRQLYVNKYRLIILWIERDREGFDFYSVVFVFD